MRIGFIFVLLFSFVVSGQNEDKIIGFAATAHNGKVLLDWEIVKGNTCNGISVLRSTDTVNFEQIGSIEGICGSTTATVSYEFTDPDPFTNQQNYYRLSLPGIGFSVIISAEVIEVGGNGYLLRPNPINDASELLFSNNAVAMYHLTVVNAQGTIVHRDHSNSDRFRLSKYDFENGLYYFTIQSVESGEIIKGKFSVIR